MLRKANTLLLDFQRYRSSRGPRFRHITTLKHFKICVLAFQNVLIFENPSTWRLVTNRWKSRLGTRKDTKKWATARWEGHRLHLSTVRHESPYCRSFKSKGRFRKPRRRSWKVSRRVYAENLVHVENMTVEVEYKRTVLFWKVSHYLI